MSGLSNSTSLVSAADDNKTFIAGTKVLTGFDVGNINAAVRYLKFWDAAAADDVTVGTTVPKLRYAIPGNAAGSGRARTFPGDGIKFDRGIVFALVTTLADSGSTGVSANEHDVDIYHR